MYVIADADYTSAKKQWNALLSGATTYKTSSKWQNDVLNGSLVFEIVNYFWRESSGSFVYIVFYNLQSTFTYISTFDQSVPLFSKLWLQILPPSYWLCLTQAKWTQGSNHYAVSLINRVKPVWAIWPNTVLSLIETYFVWIMWSNASVCIIFQKIVISALEQLLIHFWIYNI